MKGYWRDILTSILSSRGAISSSRTCLNMLYSVSVNIRNIAAEKVTGFYHITRPLEGVKPYLTSVRGNMLLRVKYVTEKEEDRNDGYRYTRSLVPSAMYVHLECEIRRNRG